MDTFNYCLKKYNQIKSYITKYFIFLKLLNLNKKKNLKLKIFISLNFIYFILYLL